MHARLSAQAAPRVVVCAQTGTRIAFTRVVWLCDKCDQRASFATNLEGSSEQLFKFRRKRRRTGKRRAKVRERDLCETNEKAPFPGLFE